MRFLLFTLIVALIATMPFVWLKKPWALGFWRRVWLFLVIYAVVIAVSATVALIVRWDDIYG